MSTDRVQPESEPTTEAILDALRSATYSYAQLKPSRFFRTELPDKRKVFPMVTLVETPTGESTTQSKTTRSRQFDVTIFLSLRGGTMNSQDYVIGVLETLEKEIVAVLEDTPILGFNVVLNERNWHRQYDNEKVKTYVRSTLTVRANQVTAPSGIIRDGRLEFLSNDSEVEPPPGANHEYVDVYDTDISTGYNEINEYTSETKNPARYTGGFSGTFVTNVRVSSRDLGTTGERLNRLQKVRANGEKQIIKFRYRDRGIDKDSENPDAHVRLTETFLATVERVRHIYNSQDTAVFQITGSLLEPGDLSASD